MDPHLEAFPGRRTAAARRTLGRNLHSLCRKRYWAADVDAGLVSNVFNERALLVELVDVDARQLYPGFLHKVG